MMMPEVTICGVISMQICVPEKYTDDQAIAFAEDKNPCGTLHGWQIRREGDRLLADSNERVSCDGRTGFVHIMLDA